MITKAKLIKKIINQLTHLSSKIIEEAIKEIIKYMSISLVYGDRIEIRGFGSFSLHYHEARIGRNPKTGFKVNLKKKFTPHFKPGKKLRERVKKI